MDFILQPRGTYDEVRAVAAVAEERGLTGVSLADHYLFGRADSNPASDVFAQLAGLAVDSRDIELIVLVAPVTFRHPAVLLKTAITIDRMSGGRFSLGVGAGWMQKEHIRFGIPYPSVDQRYQLLEEALGYLRAGLEEEPVPFGGDHFRLEAFDMQPRPVGKMPLIVGGTGAERTPRLAGQYADEYNVWAMPIEDMLARVEVARRAAFESGRDPDTIVLSTACAAIVGADEASYRRNLERAAQRGQRSPEKMEKQWRDYGYPVGTAEDAKTVIDGWEAAGVQRYYLHTLGHNDPHEVVETLEALGA